MSILYHKRGSNMQFRSVSLLSNNCTSLIFHTDSVTPIILNGQFTTTPLATDIISLSVASNMILLVLRDTDLEKSVNESIRERPVNNIVAYDMEGKYLWNISDIAGILMFPFSNGFVATKNDIDKFNFTNIKTIEGHEYYICHTIDEACYVIDLTDKKVVHKSYSK